MHRYVIGIDPGFTGAIAVYDRQRGHFIAVYDMPTYDAGGRPDIDADEARRLLVPFVHDAIGVLEKVAPRAHSPSKDGKARKEGTVSAFRFGHGRGTLLGLMVGLGLPVHQPLPSVWKLDAKVTSDKATSLAAARERCPELATLLKRKKDHGRAEAALLARSVLPALGVYEERPLNVPGVYGWEVVLS